MSTLEYREKRKLEELFGMSSGYVLGHSDRTFGNLVGDAAGIDIHAEDYCSKGTSKANKFRVFWEQQSDTLVGKVLLELIRECRATLPVRRCSAHRGVRGYCEPIAGWGTRLDRFS